MNAVSPIGIEASIMETGGETSAERSLVTLQERYDEMVEGIHEDVVFATSHPGICLPTVERVKTGGHSGLADTPFGGTKLVSGTFYGKPEYHVFVDGGGHPIKKGKKPARIDNYHAARTTAFDKLLAESGETGDFTLMLSVMSHSEDPAMARRFLALMDGAAKKAYSHQRRQDKQTNFWVGEAKVVAGSNLRTLKKKADMESGQKQAVLDFAQKRRLEQYGHGNRLRAAAVGIAKLSGVKGYTRREIIRPLRRTLFFSSSIVESMILNRAMQEVDIQPTAQ